MSLAADPEPRCPCVLLVDVSGSMSEVVGESGRNLGCAVQQDGQGAVVRSVTLRGGEGVVPMRA